MQTNPHNIAATLVFWNRGTSNGGAKSRWGRSDAGAVAKNWRLSMRRMANLARLQVCHTQCPPCVFMACLPWCNALRRFISDTLVLVILKPTCYSVLNAEHYYSYLVAAVWPVIAVVVTSSFRSSKPYFNFLSKTEQDRFRTDSAVFSGKPNRKSKINSADPNFI